MESYDDLDKKADEVLKGLREIQRIEKEKEAKNFKNPTKLSDMDLSGFADSGIDFEEIIEIFQMKCKAKTERDWGRISYGLFELFDELQEDYEDEIGEEYEARILEMKFREMKDAVNSACMPEFGFEYLAHSIHDLLYYGTKSKEEKIEILEYEVKAWEIHLKEFPGRGVLKLKKAKEQLEELRT